MVLDPFNNHLFTAGEDGTLVYYQFKDFEDFVHENENGYVI